jgi:hypothetical protein
VVAEASTRVAPNARMVPRGPIVANLLE